MGRSKRRSLLLCLAAIAAGRAKASAQAPPSFPSEVELVTVDAVVLDREGRPIPGLTRDDFVVEEDGKPRDIVSFEAVVSERTGAAPARPSPTASNEGASPGAGRAFAVILDDLSMGPRSAMDARRDVSTFLETSLHDGDEVTLATTSGDAWWTARLPEGREDLLAVVARLKGRISDSAPDFVSDYEAFAISNGRDAGGDILRRVTERFRKAFVCTDGGRGCAEDVTARAMQVDALRQKRTGATLDAVRRSLRALAPIRGRKSVLLFSPGFLQDSFTAARSVAAASREAGVAVYFIDVRGLFTAQADASEPTRPDPMDMLRQQGEETDLASAGSQALADDTGGFSVRNTNAVAAAAGKIADESRVYYLLGFHPAAGRPPGEWRRLDVTVTRKDLHVRARRGYTLRVPLDLASEVSGGGPTAKKGLDPAVAEAFDSPRDAPGIPLRAMVYAFEPRPNRTVHVVVAVDLDADAIDFEPKGGSRVAHLDVGVMAENRDTGMAFVRDETIDLEAGGSTPPGWQSLSRDFALPSGVTRVRVVMRDKASGLVGSVSQRLEIPAPGSLHLSTPIVTDRLAEAGEGGAHPEPALAAHRTFAPEGKLYCQFEVLDAVRPKNRGAPQVAAGLELRDGSGRVVRKVEPTPIAADSSGRIVRMAEMNLDGMEEGPYELVLDVRDRVGGGRIERHEPFALARKAASAPTPRAVTSRPSQAAPGVPRFAPNSPYALLVLYHSGERLEAITALRQWSDHDLERQFDAVEALVLEAEGCATCPKTLGDLVPRGRVPPGALDLPLPAAVRAAVMLYAEADRAQRAAAGPVGLEQRLACPGRLASWAGHYAALLARSPASQDFARRFFIAMTGGCQWDACFDEAESWARRGLKLFPGDARLLLDLGSVLEERATLGASLAGGAVHADTADLESELKEAQRDFTQAGSRDPSLVLAKVRLGRVLWRLGQAAPAQDALEQAIASARDPRHAYLAYLFLGQVYEDAHRLQQAEAEYRRALEVDPHAQSAAVALSHVLLLARDAEGSRRVLADGLASAQRRRMVDAYSAYLAMNTVDREELFDALIREAQE